VPPQATAKCGEIAATSIPGLRSLDSAPALPPSLRFGGLGSKPAIALATAGAPPVLQTPLLCMGLFRDVLLMRSTLTMRGVRAIVMDACKISLAFDCMGLISKFST
jgi:hypothetical protein